MRPLVTFAAALLLAAPAAAQSPERLRHTPTRRGADPATRRKSATALTRAKPGEKIPVEITYYCLQGTTRTDSEVREGIVAADPRVFPLRRHVELSAHGRPLGRFLIADTGSKIKGRTLDIWVPSCAEARRRGRHRATAVLLTRAESRAERARQRKLDAAKKREDAKRQAQERLATK